MPKYKITAPDGKAYVVTAPDGASQEQVLAYAQAHYAQQASQQPTPDSQPAANGLGSDWQNFAAGMGKSIMDNGRGLAQVGTKILDSALTPSRQFARLAGIDAPILDAAGNQYDKLRQEQTLVDQRDAPLMHTKAGVGGNIAGQTLQAIGAGLALKMAGAADAALPSSFSGSAAAGGVQGAIQPLDASQPESVRQLNAAIGAGAGAAGYALPSAVGAGARTLRGLVDPITDSGQGRIIANTLARFGQGGNMVPQPSAVPGVQPTLAEATGNAGIGQLQRAITDAGQGDGTLNQFVQRGLDNNAARVQAVRGVAGTPDDLAQAMEQRSGAADTMYGQAAEADTARLSAAKSAADQAREAELQKYGGLFRNEPSTVEAANAVRDNMLKPSPELRQLSARPGIQQASALAKKLAREQGEDLGDPLASVRGLHYVKLALDDLLTPNAGSAIGRNEQAALQGTKQALLAEIEKVSPLYAQAKDVYQQMSGPVNRMQTGQAFLEKVGGNIPDQLGNPTLTANRFAGGMKNLDQIAQKATGFKGAKAEDVFTPEQLKVLRAVSDDLARKSAAESGGRSAGSNTVQNLASQSLLGELTKSTGLDLASNSLLSRLVKPLDSAYKLFGAPDEIRSKLAELMLNPHSAESESILSRISAAQRPAFERALAPYTGAVGQQAGIGVRK